MASESVLEVPLSVAIPSQRSEARARATRESAADMAADGAAGMSPAERYADFGKGVPALERRPNDGWILASPFPMGEPARRALRGLIRVLCPPAPAPQLPDLEDRLERETRTLMRYMPLPVAYLLRIAFRLIDNAPRWLFMSRRRLQGMEPTEARAVIHKLANSKFGPIRELAGVARSLVLSIYFDQDEVHKALNYAPIPFMKSRIATRARLLAGAPLVDGDIIPPVLGLEA